ncbi:MAG: hypothetical protein A4E64_00526 [Syntrophorhabdus sp. PtaU1.Bin058]|nr:MAG: hypothetical protein A4E64_00526 [Syntrophorhabdus sp. PtaU1.Bin058]
MAEKRSHSTTVNRIIKKYGGEYNPNKGPDIKLSFGGTVEVETEKTVADAPTQLQGSRGPVFIAGTNQEAVKKAIEITEGTTIGVMDNQGNIIKPSSRR